RGPGAKDPAFPFPALLRGGPVHRHGRKIREAGRHDPRLQGNRRRQARRDSGAGLLHGGNHRRGPGQGGKIGGVIIFLMKLDLATPEKSLPTVEVEELTAPTVCGETTVLPGHARLVSGLAEGTLSYRSSSGSKRFAVKGGVLEVKDDHILVLCDEMEAAAQ